MKIETCWNDLILEIGKLDPLGIWRVGDRLISQLLKPFTTVVTNRPARYFSMYCWLLYFLNNKKHKDEKIFWEEFFKLEAIFLCAIQLHEPHNYEQFQGRIGQEAANKILSNIKKGKNTISKISNGWETNYKNPMFDFHLVEVDHGFTSKIKLTKRGEALARGYQQSISKTTLFKYGFKAKHITIKNLEDLSKTSCTCLLYNPETKMLKREAEVIIQNMLTDIYAQGTDNIGQLKNILHSIYLIINCLLEMSKNGIFFNKENWRHILATGIITDKKLYHSPAKYKNIFKKWELYNLDSLFVFCLESGLSGFLEYLHKNNGYIKKKKLIFSELSFYETVSEVPEIQKLISEVDINKTLYNFAECKLDKLKELQDALINKIKENNSWNKMVYSFLLYLFVQALYLSRDNSPDYEKEILFYKQNSKIDGLELSLIQSTDILSDIDVKSVFNIFDKIFMKEWIIYRQLDTRLRRNKEVAWFSYNHETKSYNWENSYNHDVYRAARAEILLSYLLNLNVVMKNDKSWAPGKNIVLLADYVD